MIGIAADADNMSNIRNLGMDTGPTQNASDDITEMIVDKIRELKPSSGDPPRQKLMGWARAVGIWNGFNWTFKSNPDIQGIIGSPTSDDPTYDRWEDLMGSTGVTRRLERLQDMTFCQFGEMLGDLDDDFMGLGGIIGKNSAHDMSSELWYGNKAQGNRIQREVYEGYDGDYGAAMVPEAGSQYGKIDNDSYLMVAPEGRTADGSENTYSTVQLPNEESAEGEA